MSRIRTSVCFFAISFGIVSSLLLIGCGVPPARRPPAPALGVDKEMYSMGSCGVQDGRATEKTCTSLQERVRYGLYKVGLYEKTEGKAPKEIRMTITYFRTVGYTVRLYLGPFAGKCGMEVKVEIVDRGNGKTVLKDNISGYESFGQERELLDILSDKIVAFLISAASK